jgi:hypothetical protein
MDETFDQGTKVTERPARSRRFAAGAALVASVAAIGAAALGTGSATAAPDPAADAVPAQYGTPPAGDANTAVRGEDCPEKAGDEEGAGTGAGAASQPVPSGGIDDGYSGV